MNKDLTTSEKIEIMRMAVTIDTIRKPKYKAYRITVIPIYHAMIKAITDPGTDQNETTP